MKWLLIPAFLLLAGVWWNHSEVDKVRYENTRLQRVVDSLKKIVPIRKMVDKEEFNRLISNVQYLNTNSVIVDPQIKGELDKYNEHWQLWMELGEE